MRSTLPKPTTLAPPRVTLRCRLPAFTLMIVVRLRALCRFRTSLPRTLHWIFCAALLRSKARCRTQAKTAETSCDHVKTGKGPFWGVGRTGKAQAGGAAAERHHGQAGQARR